MAYTQVQVGAPQNLPSGTFAVQGGNPQGDAWVSEVHGKFYTATRAGKVYSANVTGVTIPAIASAVVGVFAFQNPIGSGVNAELIATTLGFNATATVDVFGWYWANTVTKPATSPTLITAVSGIVGNGPTNQALAYSALTAASGVTPVLADLLVAQQSTSALDGGTLVEKYHDGRLIIPPGVAIWLCGTATGPTSGASAELAWAEWPV